MRHALVRNGEVVHVIDCDGVNPPAVVGELVPSEDALIGWLYADGAFTPPKRSPDAGSFEFTSEPAPEPVLATEAAPTATDAGSGTASDSQESVVPASQVPESAADESI